MDHNLYISILSELDKHILGTKVNISSFIAENFKKPTLNHPQLIWDDYTSIHLLQELSNRQYITFDGKIQDVIYPAKNINNDMSFDQWFDKKEFEISITLSGIEYLNQFRLNESISRLNHATLKNYKRQRFHAWAISIFALGSVVVSALNYIVTVGKACTQTHKTPKKEQLKPSQPYKSTEQNLPPSPKR